MNTRRKTSSPLRSILSALIAVAAIGFSSSPAVAYSERNLETYWVGPDGGYATLQCAKATLSTFWTNWFSAGSATNTRKGVYPDCSTTLHNLPAGWIKTEVVIQELTGSGWVTRASRPVTNTTTTSAAYTGLITVYGCGKIFRAVSGHDALLVGANRSTLSVGVSHQVTC